MPRSRPGAPMWSRRRFLSAAGLAAASVPVLSACGSPFGGSSAFAQPQVSPPAQYAGRTNVVVWSPWAGTNGEVLATLTTAFNDSQSEIYVEIQQFNGYDGVNEKVVAGLQARQIPEIAVFSDVSWNRFFLNGTIEPLGGYFTDDFGPGVYHDRLFAEGTVRGESYWVPFGRSTPLFYYNKEIFAAAGLPDRAPSTWEEFRGWGKEITGRPYNGNTVQMRAYTGSDDWYFQGLLWNFGGAISDGLDVRLDAPEAIAAAEFDRAVVNDDKIGYLAQDLNTDFTNGLVATITNSTGSLTGLLKGATFEVGAGFLPTAVDTGVPTGGGGLSIMKNADPERKQAAARYIAFLAQEEPSAQWAVGTGYLPATKAAAASPIVRNRIAENPAYGLAIEQLEIARKPDVVRCYVPTAITDMRAVIQRLYTENADPTAVMTQTAEKLRGEAAKLETQYTELVAG
jgi:sn-glycerol 3-phosphate transport system substrate-binding protein